MARQWTTKAFKSGNSVALRLPKGAGFVEGDDVVILPHESGRISIWKESEALTVLMSLYGSMSPGFMKNGRGNIDQDDRVWDTSSNKSVA
jgi:antitoxin VapB